MMDKFAAISRKASCLAGSWQAFIAALTIVVVWIIGGFFVGFDSQLYQLLINTATTIITFLMVFLIQGAQVRDQAAVQAKLNELIHALDKADDRLIDLENASEEHLREVQEAARANKI
jgi:low affinity Fe/Cu permease